MQYPQFFDKVQTIKVEDKLADFLGAFDDGIIEFNYLDVVKFAGHSCPTIASTYLMCAKALNFLYQDKLPQRGEIKVEFRELPHQGVAGVIAKVASQITGASSDDGFGGIANNFNRKNLLLFGQNISSNIKITRLDTNKFVNVYLNLSVVPSSARQNELLQKILGKNSSLDETAEFKILWQNRVKQILIDHKDDNAMIQIFEE